MKKWLGLLVFALATPAAMAVECENFSGQYVNEADTAKPPVILAQKGCDSITLTDNANVAWIIHLDGVRTALPKVIRDQMGLNTVDTFYTATWSGYNSIHIRAVAKVGLQNDNKTSMHLGLEYEGEAYLLDAQNRKGMVSLETRELRIVSVDANDVTNHEVNGFLQGANYVLNAFKYFIKATLK